VITVEAQVSAEMLAMRRKCGCLVFGGRIAKDEKAPEV
jgi:hypothetical protein